MYFLFEVLRFPTSGIEELQTTNSLELQGKLENCSVCIFFICDSLQYFFFVIDKMYFRPRLD
jgi:hypothetical protein